MLIFPLLLQACCTTSLQCRARDVHFLHSTWALRMGCSTQDMLSHSAQVPLPFPVQVFHIHVIP